MQHVSYILVDEIDDRQFNFRDGLFLRWKEKRDTFCFWLSPLGIRFSTVSFICERNSPEFRNSDFREIVHDAHCLHLLFELTKDRFFFYYFFYYGNRATVSLWDIHIRAAEQRRRRIFSFSSISLQV